MFLSLGGELEGRGGWGAEEVNEGDGMLCPSFELVEIDWMLPGKRRDKEREAEKERCQRESQEGRGAGARQ